MSTKYPKKGIFFVYGKRVTLNNTQFYHFMGNEVLLVNKFKQLHYNKRERTGYQRQLLLYKYEIDLKEFKNIGVLL